MTRLTIAVNSGSFFSANSDMNFPPSPGIASELNSRLEEMAEIQANFLPPG